MSIVNRNLFLAGLLVCLIPTGLVAEENEGQADLHRATIAKLSVRNLTDLNEVIRLCESAIEKGLDEETLPFAKQLLASVCVQRGGMIAQSIFDTMPPTPDWVEYRSVALIDLEKAVELDPQQPRAFYMIARLNVLPRGDADRATEALEEAIRLSEDIPQVRAEAHLLRAELQKNLKKKLPDLDEATRAMPGEVSAWRIRGSVHADLKNFEKALSDLNTAIELEPEHALTHQTKGLVLIEMEKLDEAMEAFEKAHEFAPRSAAPLAQQARVHAMQEDLPAALEVLGEALVLEPANLGVLLLRASIHQEREDVEKALADVDRVLELSPKQPMAMRFRAMLLAGSGKFDLAIDQLESLQAGSPEDADITLQMAMFYSAEEKYAEAAEKYSEVLAKHPGNIIALRGRADALLSIGKHAEAVADYDKALAIEPEDTGVLNNLAWVLATSPDDELRDGARSIELATKACELTDFEQAHILSTLASGYAETGDFKTARKWSRKSIELADEEMKEPLQEELESYKADKPWRELKDESGPAETDEPVEETP